ncbi:MAG: UDP-3-O-(3-hydroxymyristoyl)glucosamine N-acyltransferase, partial [Candidatus Omnitrophica bacterium]|nr:UDP-3-O-(3-hydroxymyristoyl)glucosamine N-acyltransferase [Candidatus Omnitrophota bacterium]
MKFGQKKTLGEIAQIPYSQLGSEDWASVEVDGVNTAGTAEPGDIVWAETKEAIESLATSGAAAAIVPIKVQETPIPAIRHPLPKLVFGMLLQEFVPTNEGDPETAEIHPEAHVDPSARICGGAKVGKGSVIKAGAVIGKEARVGANCIIGYNSVIEWKCELGDRVIVHNGTIIGTDGFGYVQKPCDDDPGTFESLKIPHAGIVIVEDDVEIGANTCIDRGAVRDTMIGEGTKIDNLVQIAHNCEIGRHNIIISLVGISGTSKTGKNVILAGQTGIADHTTIGDGAILMAGTKVAGEVPPQAKVMGYP